MNHHKRLKKALLTTGGLRPAIQEQFGVFRKALFVDRLGWSLKHNAGVELDEFDNDNAIYAIIYESEGIVAGFRAIKTTSPYLVKTHFGHLGCIRSFPARSDYYEISRFGILAAERRLALGLLNYALMFEFARQRNASALVAMSDLTHERLLRVIGIRTRRYGPPATVGMDAWGRPILAVAGDIPLADQSPELTHRLSTLCQTELEIIDETSVLGRTSLYA